MSFTADRTGHPPADRRQPALDGLRGWAALAVTFYHGLLHFDIPSIDRVLYRPIALVDWVDMPAKLLLIVFNGESAVLLFFILSGLVLRGALERLAELPMYVAAADFALRRITRIYPAVIVCMVLFYAVSVACFHAGFTTFPHFAPINLLQNATLYFPSMHGPSWSVQVEMCAVPFLLIADIMRRRWGAAGLMAAFIYAMIAIEYPVLVGSLVALPAYLFALYLGMLIGERSVADAARRLHPSTWVIALIVFVFFRHITERRAVSGLIAQVLAGGLLVACVAYHEDRLAVFLRNRVSAFLGRISYSFYLLNVIALYGCWAAIEANVAAPGAHPVAWGVLSACVATVVTLPFAMLSERYVERPGIALGRVVTRWRTRAATAGGDGYASQPAGEV